jgi:hypothetical protein
VKRAVPQTVVEDVDPENCRYFCISDAGNVGSCFASKGWTFFLAECHSMTEAACETARMCELVTSRNDVPVPCRPNRANIYHHRQ